MKTSVLAAVMIFLASCAEPEDYRQIARSWAESMSYTVVALECSRAGHCSLRVKEAMAPIALECYANFTNTYCSIDTGR